MDKMYVRFDFTEGKKYSLSKPTTDIVRKLDNKLVINYYYEKRAKEAPGFNQVIQYINDTLKEYEGISKGMIEYKVNELSYENPDHRQKIDEIEQKGIRTVSLSQTEGTEQKSTLGFSGITLDYKGKSSVMGVLFSDQRFEYNLDVEIQKLVGQSNHKVGIYVSSVDKTLENNYRSAYRYIANEYSELKNITNTSEITEDLEVLILIGGDLLSNDDIFYIDQFVMKGGKLICLTNGVKLNLNNQYGGPQAFPSGNKIIDLLRNYGITINKDLVGDNESYNPVVQRNNIGLPEKFRYPLWIKVTSDNINKKNPIVEDFDDFNLFWASSITFDESIKDNVDVLIKTTKKAWSMDNDYKVDLDTYKYPVQEGNNQYNLGIIYDGKVKSYFIDKTKDIPNKEIVPILEGNSKIMVVANEEFVTNDFVVNRDDELLMLLNVIDSFTKDGSLIQIRNKGRFIKPLNKIYNVEMLVTLKNVIIFITTYLLPILILVIAYGVISKRKNKYKILQVKISGKNNEV